jgi:hypothetical protein
MWNKIKSKIMGENKEQAKTSSETTPTFDPNRKTFRFEIGDNVYWLLWWTGIFILLFFEKC